MNRYPLPVQDFDDLMTYAVMVIDSLNLEEQEIIMLADAFKTFAGEYARLLSENKVPDDMKYRIVPWIIKVAK